MERRIPAIRVLFTGVALAALAVSGLAQSRAEPVRDPNPPAEQRLLPYPGQLPACADSFVFGEIASAFAHRESEYWGSSLAIVNFDRVSETGYRTNGPSFIPRRYCQGEAVFNDGQKRRVVYNIGEALGFIGVGYGVTWCVEGLDRDHAFSPKCRAAGP